MHFQEEKKKKMYLCFQVSAKSQKTFFYEGYMKSYTSIFINYKSWTRQVQCNIFAVEKKSRLLQTFLTENIHINIIYHEKLDLTKTSELKMHPLQLS